jgi:hypothetical protein
MKHGLKRTRRIMSNPAHEQLLSYLLDACDGDERSKIEEHLRQNDGLRRDLEVLKKALDPLSCDKSHYEAPMGLAHRCCEYVFSRVELIPVALSSQGDARSVNSRRWSWLDIAVAGAIAASVLFLIAPAVYQSRQQSLKLACQNNLKDIGTALASYSDRNGGYYPMPSRDSRATYAGMWAPKLINEGYLPAESKVLCPSSSSECKSSVSVPKMADLEAMSEDQQKAVLSQLGAGIGITLPYRDREDGQFKGHRNLRRSKFVIMADVPGPNASNSRNHGGDGQNVLFDDGRVVYLIDACPDHEDNNIFRNADGEVAPGLHQDDTVIVPGHIRIYQQK